MTNQKIALVTGATRGIGHEVARQLGALGMTVLAGARDPQRGASVADELGRDGSDVRAVALDVADTASVTAAAAWISGELGRLDVLVNNAGIAVEDRPGDVGVADVHRTFETNVFGVVAVTRAMLPLLRESAAGRVVNMSSRVGSLGEWCDPESPMAQHAPNMLAYLASKTALNAVTVSTARALRGSRIKVNSACPGLVATDLNGHRGDRTVQEGARIVVRLATLPDDGPSGGFFDEDGSLRW